MSKSAFLSRLKVLLPLAVLVASVNPAAGQLVLRTIVGDVDSVSVNTSKFADVGYSSFLGPVDGISVTSNVTFSLINGIAGTAEFRVGFQLLDSQGTVLSLDDGGNTVTTVYDDDWEGDPDTGFPISFLITDPPQRTETFGQVLRPVDQLDPTAEYTVRVTVFWLDTSGPFFDIFRVDDTLDDPGNSFIHFVGTVSGDFAVNTLAVLNSVSFTKRSALVGANPADDAYGFRVMANTTLHRFDDWNSARAPSAVDVIYDVQLWRRDAVNGDEAIPLVEDRFTISTLLFNHDEDFFGFEFPSEVTLNQSMRIVPDGVQLDSVNDLFYVIVTVSHIEVPLIQLEKTGNSQEGPDTQLMHFNGNLIWKDINTDLQDFINDPAASGTWSASYITSSLTDANGEITGSPGYVYGPTSPTIRLESDGTARVVTPSLSATVTIPVMPDIDSVANVRFKRSNLILNHGIGLLGTLTLYLPTGMGYAPDPEQHRFNGTIDFAGTLFDQSLQPIDASFTYAPGSTFAVMEETKPLAIAANEILWTVGTGEVLATGSGAVEFVREKELLKLEGSGLPSSQTIKRSNDHYYRGTIGLSSSLTISVNPGPVGDARMTMDLDLATTTFETHFPYAVPVGYAAGYMNVGNDLVDVGTSWLSGISDLVLNYEQGCQSDECLPSPMLQEMRLRSVNDTLLFTRDGGLVTTGTVQTSGSAVDTLAWGYIPSLTTYHHQTSSFAEGDFHMPGHFIRGDQDTSPDSTYGPGVILYTGFLASDPTVLERPASFNYLVGLTDYAGFNYRALVDSAFTSSSVLTGIPVTFDMTGRCKYYIRRGGVTGIHEAVPGTFPPSLVLANYQMNFSQYGLNYRSSQPGDSRTEGDIFLPYPSDFNQDFEELLFTCLGGLDGMKVPEGPSAQTMRYWVANILIHSLQFKSEDACVPNSDTYLLAGVSAEAAYVDSPLIGTLGFIWTGELMTGLTSATIDENSRLKLPSVVKFDGPVTQNNPDNPGETRNEIYQLNPVSDAYYNDYASTSEQAEGDGKINFAATLDVAFFEDLEVHVQTSARNVLPTQSIPIYLMGGWTANGTDTFFNTSGFDSGNVGFPNGVVEAVYRNDPGNGGDPTPYLIHARQDWIGGLIEFDYPLKWSFSTRSFASFAPEEDDLVVIRSEHQLEYLSQEKASLSVGITYQGMPQVNLTNFVINEIDKATGVYQAVLNAAKKPIVDAIEDGIDEMSSLLEDQMELLYEDFLSSKVETFVVDPLYNELETLANTGTYDLTQVQLKLLSRIKNGSNNLKFLLGKLATDVNGANYLLDEIDSRLEDIELGITAIIEGGDKDAQGNLIPAANINNPEVAALLAKDVNGDFQVLGPLVERLLEELAPDISSELNALLSGAIDDLNGRINEYFESAKPTVDQIIVIMTDLRDVVGQIRTALQPAGQLITELETIIANASGEIDTLTDNIVTELNLYFSVIPNSNAFLSYTEAEIKSRIRAEIRDLFFGSDFIADIQLTLKQYLYDTDAAINAALSEAIAQANEVTRDVISDLLSEVDESINGLLGDVGDVLGAGRLDGYAQFNGDALRRLHIDLYMQLNVPDEMEFNAYLTIEQLESDGDGSCGTGTPGEPYTEVSLGATDVPANWISPDLRISVGTKFVFGTTPNFKLLGMGGSFELTSGVISFEAFKITDLGAALMFGKTENYLAAKVGVAFNSYEAFGGVYFGRTCSIDPLLLVDKEVALVLGVPNPTFTGIYVYGECHIPISEVILGIPASCFFRISAGVGAGAFYFVEGNTLGGKIYAAVSGEALCIVGIKGEVTMVGLTQEGELRLRGKGRLSGKVGPCPFCIKFGKTATITFDNGSWDVDI